MSVSVPSLKGETETISSFHKNGRIFCLPFSFLIGMAPAVDRMGTFADLVVILKPNAQRFLMKKNTKAETTAAPK